MPSAKHLPLSATLATLLLWALPWSAASESRPAPPTSSALPAVASDTVENQEEKEEEKPGLPLKPERTISFTATEGSWLSLDVSPDGRTVVFDLLGDLYTVPLEGGKASRITRGMGFDSQPRFSPDGARVVFVSDRDGGENVWILDPATGDTAQVTKGRDANYHSPEWTLDGSYIVVSRSHRLLPTKLWMFHVDGGSGIQLVKDEEGAGFWERLRMSGAAFGPDDRYIWYAERRGTWQYNAQFPQYRLAVYDRETGERYGRSSRYGSAFRPTLSRDGRWLAYGTRHEAETGIRLRELATGEERWLAYPVQRDDKESVASRDVYPGMAFTPDSRELVAYYGGGIWRVPVDGSEPIPVPFEAEVELGLGPELAFDYAVDDASEFTVRQIRGAVPSPDGRRLAFAALDKLYAMDWPEGEPRRLTRSTGVTEADPAWSPDGSWVAYVTWTDADGGHVWKARADGRGDPVRLSRTGAVYQQLAWSPDGERIVAVRGAARALRETPWPWAPEATEDLVWIPAEGGEAVLIAPTEGRSRPHFTRDPSRLYLHHGEKGLLSVRLDGTDERRHVRVEGAKLPGAEQPMRAGAILMGPAGDRAVAQLARDLYVVAVPRVGGEPPVISVADPEKAAVPARQLTDVGGEFPAWGGDGKTVHWSLGNAHFVYDLERAKAVEDSLARARREREADEGREEADEGAEAEREDRGPDAGAGEGRAGGEQEKEEPKEEKEEEKYRPEERRIRIQAPRDIPRGAAVLRGARVITMRGHEVIEDADLVVRDNRIAGVGRRGEVAVPQGAQVIDLSGTTIVPGFVDTHAHMWPAWGIHKTQVWMYLANLAYGVTTTRDPQTSTTDVLAYADRVEAGEMLGPRVYSTGPGVFTSDRIKNLDHARDVLRRYSDYYDTKTIKMYLAGNRQQRQWIIMAARELGLTPTTEGGLDLKLNLTQIIDGYPGHEHSFPIAPLYGDFVRLVAESRTVYTPTLLVSYGGPWAEEWFYSRENPHDDPKLRRFTSYEELARKTRRRGAWFLEEEHVFPRHAAVLREIVEAGGRAGVGSHGQLQGLGYHWELWAMASGGLSNHEALRVATLVGADALGLAGDLGSIEPGKLADLVVLEENPLEDLRHTNTIRSVMKNGRLYDGDTLDELWPRERPLPPQHWQGSEPRTAAGMREP